MTDDAARPAAAEEGGSAAAAEVVIDPTVDVTLVAEDGAEFTVKHRVMALSDIIKAADPTERIPVACKGIILAQVIEFCTHHVDEAMPAVDKKARGPLDKLVPKWDFDFANKDKTTVFELLVIADQLELEQLRNLMAAKVNSMIEGLSLVEVNKLFRLDERKMSPEEQAKWDEEHKWALDLEHA